MGYLLGALLGAGVSFAICWEANSPCGKLTNIAQETPFSTPGLLGTVIGGVIGAIVVGNIFE